jgi:hypothetical protein
MIDLDRRAIDSPAEVRLQIRATATAVSDGSPWTLTDPSAGMRLEALWQRGGASARELLRVRRHHVTTRPKAREHPPGTRAFRT